MIEEGSKELTAKIKLDTIRHADLKVTLLNSYSRKSGDNWWTIEDVIDRGLADDLKKLMKDQPKKKVSKKEQSARWSAAGNAYVSQFDGLK